MKKFFALFLFLNIISLTVFAESINYGYNARGQYVPTSYVPIEGENAEKLENLLSAVDDLDDVTNVYTNAE